MEHLVKALEQAEANYEKALKTFEEVKRELDECGPQEYDRHDNASAAYEAASEAVSDTAGVAARAWEALERANGRM